MYKWPDGWREALARDLGAENDAFMMRVFDAWQRSTPLDPYTNNPLGMPSVPGVVPELYQSGFALFPEMRDFRARFVMFLTGGSGTVLREALIGGNSLAAVYRAIHALDWPANRTETDYPAAVLDLVSEPVRTRLETAARIQRKTAGTIGYSAAAQNGPAKLSDAMRNVAIAATEAARAMRHYNREG